MVPLVCVVVEQGSIVFLIHNFYSVAHQSKIKLCTQDL